MVVYSALVCLAAKIGARLWKVKRLLRAKFPRGTTRAGHSFARSVFTRAVFKSGDGDLSKTFLRLTVRTYEHKHQTCETDMSVRLRNRLNSPINGFKFIEPKSGAHFSSWGFDDMVRHVILHRQHNPRFNLPTDRVTVENEVDEYNAMRMVSIPGAESFIVFDDSPFPKFSAPHRPGLLASAVGGVKKLLAGGSVLLEWLGEGGVAVPAEQSAARARVCTNRPDGQPCPKNGKGDWTALFTQEASERIRRQLSIRNDMKLTTPDDDKLGVCDACLCPLKLKVHTPLEKILKHTSAKVRAELDPGCWVLAEEKGA